MAVEFGPYARTGGVRTEIACILPTVSDVFDDHGFRARVTHLTDGVHSVKSLHYVGYAADIIWVPYRTLPRDVAMQMRYDLYFAINGFPIDAGIQQEYDIIFEGSHFHIEYQPKVTPEVYKAQVAAYLDGDE